MVHLGWCPIAQTLARSVVVVGVKVDENIQGPAATRLPAGTHSVGAGRWPAEGSSRVISVAVYLRGRLWSNS